YFHVTGVQTCALPISPRGVGDLLHHAADRDLDVDGRVLAGVGDAAGQHDVAVEDRAGSVGDGLLLVVAFGQHGVEGGDRAAAVGAVAGALHQLRQLGEHARRVGAGGGRLAD